MKKLSLLACVYSLAIKVYSGFIEKYPENKETAGSLLNKLSNLIFRKDTILYESIDPFTFLR